MVRTLDRDKLLAAFDEIGRAAVEAGTRLEIAVYGGSALMLASNFRFATEDVDVSRSSIRGPSGCAASWTKSLEPIAGRRTGSTTG